MSYPDQPREYTLNGLMSDDQSLPEGINRIAAAVEYDGSTFCGWQKQKHSPSVQAEINRALSQVANHPIETVCAGRTDTGVHATNQIIHFDTSSSRQPINWLKGTNSALPDGIRLHWLSEMEAQFHARFSATSRTYRYVIYNTPVRPALLADKVSWYRRQLDETLMKQAAALLTGEQDFSSFRAVGCQSNSPNRYVFHTDVWRQGKLVIFEICANAFLYHMVRNLAGALIKVGERSLSINDFASIFEERDRTQAPATAVAQGLYLVNVGYPDRFKIPTQEYGPEFVIPR